MDFIERLDNIYLIDTKMFGFDNYMSAYLVKGEKIALVDTGLPSQLDTVRNSIKAHGFSTGDISYIFITHSHPDHSGNAAALLKENPEAKVYIHPLGVEQLVDPSIELAIRKKALPPKMHARVGEIEAVPPERVQNLNDGDIFDLGNGEILKIMFAPGHQPDGIVIFEEKNSGLFINDLIGNYLPDADAHYPLSPPGSDHIQAIESLKKLLPHLFNHLYLGHYGIVDKPKEVITRAIDKMQQLLDIGTKYMREGKPELIADEVYAMILPELKKLRAARGEEVYQYAAREHVASQAKLFAKYAEERLKTHT